MIVSDVGTNTTSAKPVIEYARDYKRRGWEPLPIPFREKKPILPDWPNFRATEDELPRYFGRSGNVGILLGEPSGNLVDVDLDHRIAVEIAEQYLPPNNAVFGRAGKLRSHFLYRAVSSTHKRQVQGVGMIIELRSTGCQTIAPGSTHTSGEFIEWAEDGEPAEVDAD